MIIFYSNKIQLYTLLVLNILLKQFYVLIACLLVVYLFLQLLTDCMRETRREQEGPDPPASQLKNSNLLSKIKMSRTPTFPGKVKNTSDPPLKKFLD